MNEQDLNRLLQSQNETDLEAESEKQFQQKVRRTMHRSFYGRVLGTVLLIALLTAGLLFGASKAADLICYDPGTEPAFLEDDSWDSGAFTLLLEDTICTYFPGTYCWMLEPPQSRGFGRYSADLLLSDPYGIHFLAGPATAQFRIGGSRLDPGHAPLFTQSMEFLDPSVPCTIPGGPEGLFPSMDSIRQELRDLPRSAQLDVSISFPVSLSSDQAAQLINTAPVRVRWLALEGQNTSLYSQSAGGMFLDHMRGNKLTPEAAARYPDYFLSEDLTGQQLERCLQSRLQLLLDHPKFVALMETGFGDLISMPRLEERLAHAQEGWACYGMRLVGSPAEVEALLEEYAVEYARINDVKLSRFEQ